LALAPKLGAGVQRCPWRQPSRSRRSKAGAGRDVLSRGGSSGGMDRWWIGGDVEWIRSDWIGVSIYVR
jgi:hypothetical protein